MGVEEVIYRFRDQFEWQPHIENVQALDSYKQYIVCGMGGSALAPCVIQQYGQRSSPIIVHRDYGLPPVSDTALQESLVILSSYSGNTEEVIDSMSAAIERGLRIAVISIGGRLVDLARDRGIPYIQMPDLKLEPRMALGLSMLALARLMQDSELEESIRAAGMSVHAKDLLEEGARISTLFTNKVPLIYASTANLPLAYIWKIKCNENAKIPAFCAALPEWCHNELTGFDVVGATRALSANMHTLFLEDDTDHPRIQKRMRVAGEMLRNRGIPTEYIRLEGDGFIKVFRSIVLADWVTFDMALRYKVPNPETPLIAEFKDKMAHS